MAPPPPRRLAALALALASLICGPARAEGGLTLHEAIRTALARNERSREAEAKIEQSEADVDRAFVGFMPVVTLSASDTAKLWPPERSTSSFNTVTGTVQATQPLVNLPAFPAYSAAKTSREAQRHQSADDKRRLAFETAQAFVDVLAREQVVQAARKRLEYARALLEVAQGRASAEIASTNDVTRAELEVASATREVAQREGDVKASNLNLRFLMNADAVPSLEPPEALFAAAEGVQGEVEPLVASAATTRPDLKAARERVEAARTQMREVQMRYMPTLSAFAAARVTSDAGATSRWLDPSIGLNLSWLIYDGGTRGADRRGREVQAEIAGLQASLLTRRLSNEVRLAAVSLEASQGVHKSAVMAATAARRVADESVVLYRQGLARAIEVFDASTKRFDAEVSLASARLQMLKAYLDLRQALGKAPVEGVLP